MPQACTEVGQSKAREMRPDLLQKSLVVKQALRSSLGHGKEVAPIQNRNGFVIPGATDQGADDERVHGTMEKDESEQLWRESLSSCSHSSRNATDASKSKSQGAWWSQRETAHTFRGDLPPLSSHVLQTQLQLVCQLQPSIDLLKAN